MLPEPIIIEKKECIHFGNKAVNEEYLKRNVVFMNICYPLIMWKVIIIVFRKDLQFCI